MERNTVHNWEDYVNYTILALLAESRRQALLDDVARQRLVREAQMTRSQESNNLGHRPLQPFTTLTQAIKRMVFASRIRYMAR